MRKRVFFLSSLMMAILGVWGQTPAQWGQKFEQLGTSLPTPNTYRTASGAPGKDYWQQRADYKIEIDTGRCKTGNRGHRDHHLF